MSRLSFAKDLKSALRGSTAVAVIARKSRFDSGDLPELFPAEEQKLLYQLATEAKPGAHGGAASSLVAGANHRLHVGTIPDTGSRYNTASRPDAVYRTVSAAHLNQHKKATLVLILEDESHYFGALAGVARAFPLFSRKAGFNSSGQIQIVAFTPDGTLCKASTGLKERLDATRSSAALVDSPPTEMNPEALAKAAREQLSHLKKVTFREFVGAQLVKKGLMGIHSVGRCAVKAPRLLIASYKPTRGSGMKVALVGKGVTFDTGGLHLKGRGSMETMKSDMGGSAAVLGAFQVLARTNCPHEVHLLLCLAENAIGSNAFKPDDIITMHSGKTVEINNTDAEGRLLLGDGVSYAARELKADVIFDAATLTGAQMISTGANHAAVMSNDGDLEETMVIAGREAGELVHPLPFAPEFYQQEFKSTVADMRNSVKNRANAQSSCAAQFVYSHIQDTGVHWAHVDLAGPSFRNDRGTGYGVGLLSMAVSSL